MAPRELNVHRLVPHTLEREHVMAPCEMNVHRLVPTHAGEESVVNKSSCFQTGRLDSLPILTAQMASGLKLKHCSM